MLDRYDQLIAGFLHKSKHLFIVLVVQRLLTGLDIVFLRELLIDLFLKHVLVQTPSAEEM